MARNHKAGGQGEPHAARMKSATCITIAVLQALSHPLPLVLINFGDHRRFPNLTASVRPPYVRSAPSRRPAPCADRSTGRGPIASPLIWRRRRVPNLVQLLRRPSHRSLLAGQPSRSRRHIGGFTPSAPITTAAASQPSFFLMTKTFRPAASSSAAPPYNAPTVP